MKKEPIGYIYMFTNRINGKKYIGQHEFKDGIDENYFGSGSIFANAKEKYGIENFKFDILCWCNSKEELDNAESYFIGFKYYTYANTGRGYNIADGGNGGSKFRGKTEEEMREIRKKKSETWNNKSEEEMRETRKKISEAWNNKSEEEKREIRKKKSETWNNKSEEEMREIRKKKSETWNNKSEEEMREIGKKQSEAWNNKSEEELGEWKKKISEAHQGKIHSEETRQKMSENHADFKGEKNPSARKVRCLETGEEFTTLKEASEWCEMKNKGNITLCCKGKRKSAGKHPITGEKLHWEYVIEEEIEVNLNLLTISNIKLNI